MVYWVHVAGTFLMRFLPVSVAYRLAGWGTPLVLQVFVGPADIAVYYAATKTLALVNFIYFAVSAACASAR